MENQVVTDAGSDTFDTGMCQVIDKTKLNALKTPLFKNLVAPIALVPANINMSFALHFIIFYLKNLGVNYKIYMEINRSLFGL